MSNTRLDATNKYPRELDEYRSNYGWHFSKKLCQFACSKMKGRDGKPITPYSKEDVDNLLQRHNIKLNNQYAYDYVFVANMAKADYFGSSITDETHLALFIKDYVDDPDGYAELPMTRFLSDVIAKGDPIIWEDMI